MTTPSSETPIVLEVKDISKRFGAVRALTDVSFSIKRGEVVGLVGDNGAGKSTLVGVVSGVLSPDGGGIRVDGTARTFTGPTDAHAVGIETVYQYLSLIPTLDIVENIFLNREVYGPGLLRSLLRIMDGARMRSEVAKGFEKMGLTLPPPRTKVAALSGGQRQAVAIARAVLWGQHIVLLDEPTAALGVKQTEIVLSFIERLKAHGVAVIFISHNMPHVLRVTDRVVVLRLGRKAWDGPTSELDGARLVGLITGAAGAGTIAVDEGEG